MRFSFLLPGLFLVLCLAVVVAPASAELPDPDDHWESDEPVIFIQGDALHYYGKTNKTGTSRLMEVLGDPDAAARLAEFHVASPGGDGLAAIAIAEEVLVRGLDVVVVGKGCGSACANYIFTPAAHKIISDESLVIWHRSCVRPRDFKSRDEVIEFFRQNYGTSKFDFTFEENGVPVEDPERVKEVFEERLEQFVDISFKYISDLKEGQQRLLNLNGRLIDFDITCLGDYIQLPEVQEDVIGYSYTMSVGDMARFGVCNVQARSDYAEWAEGVIRDNESLRDSTGVVRLADYPDLKLVFPEGYCDQESGESWGKEVMGRWRPAD